MKLNKQVLFFIVFILLASTSCFFQSCRKDLDFLTEGGSGLRFSRDTLRFDTVFTTQGSATRFIRVFNDNEQPVKLSKVRLKNGSASFFNLNVDGTAGDDVKDVEIQAKDSIYVFVEVTIDPNQADVISPYVITEEIEFELNGKQSFVVLEAWGQNANYIPNSSASNNVALLTCNFGNVTWDDPKPYVIFGVLLLDSCTLNLPAGCRVYVHGGIANNNFGIYSDGFIYVLERGKLLVNGTKEKPVIIQADRLEKEFEDVPGQWSGIRIGRGSKGNEIRHAIIKNAIIGVRVDSLAQFRIYNSRIFNTSNSGILAESATVVAQNCLFYNNGGPGFQAEFGGSYFVYYCTIGSFGNDKSAISLNDIRCLDPFCNTFVTFPLKADIRNSVLTGSQNDEIDLLQSSVDNSDFDVKFKNCYVRTKNLTTQFPKFFTEICTDCITYKPNQALFKEINKDNYKLDTLSVVEEKAISINNVDRDIDERLRDATMPDIGCFEYYVE